MVSRRKFVKSAIAGAGLTSISAFLPKTALAKTVGPVADPAFLNAFGNPSNPAWAITTDPGLFGRVWGARFTNVLPWALDPTNTVLAKALNVDATGFVPGLNKSVVPAVLEGLKINPAKPETNIGFVFKPDAGNTYNIKAGQIDWPMLAPLEPFLFPPPRPGVTVTRNWKRSSRMGQVCQSPSQAVPSWCAEMRPSMSIGATNWLMQTVHRCLTCWVLTSRSACKPTNRGANLWTPQPDR